MATLVKMFLSVVLLSFCTNMLCQEELDKKTKKRLKQLEVFEDLVTMIEEKPIEFVADWAYPVGFGSVNLISNPNYLRIVNDSAFLHMPFFGRAYQTSQWERGGFYSKDIMTKKEIKVDKSKQKITIEFTIKGENDRYQCLLEVIGKSSVSLSIISNNRSTISYSGEVEEWIKDADKKK